MTRAVYETEKEKEVSPAASPSARSHARPYRESWCSWIPSSDRQRMDAEQDVLQAIQGLYDQTRIGNLNTIYYTLPVRSASEPAPAPVLLLHGFGGGCALWVSVWRRLLESKRHIYAVDLPGFARSHRVPFKGRTPDEAIDYFLTQLLEWVGLSGITTPFVLAGHSLGGYISAQFAGRYPKLVSKLILIDPWGLPTEPSDSKKKQIPLQWRVAAKVIGAFNPLSGVRALGPWGPDIFGSKRKHIADGYSTFFEDPNVVVDYTYHANSDAPCGEAAFQTLYKGLAFARKPLEHELLPMLDGTDIPLYFIYGEFTYMDHGLGKRLSEQYSGTSKVFMIKNAGHNVFSDNHVDFANHFLEILQEPEVAQ